PCAGRSAGSDHLDRRPTRSGQVVRAGRDQVVLRRTGDRAGRPLVKPRHPKVPLHPKMAGELEGEFVVFLIGMRINRPWKVHKWLPVFLGMPRMLKELQNRPESGFLGHTMGLPVMVQYWRSFEDLEAYARANDQSHLPAWVAF